MFLLDTNVISELRKLGSGRADGNVASWDARTPANIRFLSVVVLFELEKGVLLLERKEPRAGADLRDWLERRVMPAFGARILAYDADSARQAAVLQVARSLPERDAMIAATALVHGLTVATRNVADFAGTGCEIVNPWDETG